MGAREPCPCGSGRRFKNCHGQAARRAAAAERPPERPFAGLTDAVEWVAMRELVPAGTATVSLTGPHAGEAHGRQVLVVTLLPAGVPGLVRSTGEILVAVQAADSSGDPSRDVADAILRAAETGPGQALLPRPVPLAGPRLPDLLGPDQHLDVVVHDGFDFWVDPAADGEAQRADVDRADAAIVPTAKVPDVPAAYLARDRGRDYLRQVLPHDEEPLLDALARLRTAGADSLRDGARLLGTFRALGHLVPLWELSEGSAAAELTAPLTAFAARLADALADSRPLSADERRARAALQNRQLTLR